MLIAEVGLGDLLWSIITIFFMLMDLMMLFSVITDLFRDQEASGVTKAVWVVGLLIFPLVSMLLYLVLRGEGMAKRQHKAARQAEEATESYIRSIAGSSPADQIAQAKALLDQGAIDEAEYARLKERALA